MPTPLLKIISWNVNGLRSVERKGFVKWLQQSRADIVCLQEIKVQLEQIPPELKNPSGYTTYLNAGKRKGYAGVLVYSKEKPKKVNNLLGLKRFDNEGRFLELYFPSFILSNIYLPHGGRQKENLTYKLQVYQKLLNHLAGVKNKNIVLIGDFNIAHQEIDLARPKNNKNNIMFTPEERQQIDKILNLGFVDTFRHLHKGAGHYTWWPYFANARQRNLGWRIDYAFVSKPLSPRLKSTFILPQVPGSDHCPIGLDLIFS